MQEEFYSVPSEELDAITLQVALVGKDGIVIASDRMLSYYDHGRLEDPRRRRQQAATRKILENKNTGVICAYAGYRTAEALAHTVCLCNPRGCRADFEWENTIRQAVDRVQRPANALPMDELLVARLDDPSGFWLEAISKPSVRR